MCSRKFHLKGNVSFLHSERHFSNFFLTCPLLRKYFPTHATTISLLGTVPQSSFLQVGITLAPSSLGACQFTKPNITPSCPLHRLPPRISTFYPQLQSPVCQSTPIHPLPSYSLSCADHSWQPSPWQQLGVQFWLLTQQTYSLHSQPLPILGVPHFFPL